jgi:hypothetical protein
MKHDNIKFLRLALSAFQKVDRNSKYYYPAKYYSVFAYTKLGNSGEAIRILDTLVKVHYYGKGKVKMLRDSLDVINHQKSN